MFERFTKRARHVLVFAQEEARDLGHDFIGTEHILLGVIREGEGIGAKALQRLDVSLDDARAKILETLVTRGPHGGAFKMPFTPRAKKVLELSLKEALQLGHNYIGTEHLVLGLVREGEGVGATVLQAMGVSLGDVRKTVIDLLAGFTAADPAARPAATRVAARTVRTKGGSPGRITTGELLAMIVDEPDSDVVRALARLGVTASSFAGVLDTPHADVPAAADPTEAVAESYEFTVGTRKIVISMEPAAGDDELADALDKLAEQFRKDNPPDAG